MPNYNTATGIPFGTIYTKDLDSDLFDTLLCGATDHSYLPAMEEFARSEGWIDREDWTDEHGLNPDDHLDCSDWLEETGKMDQFNDSYPTEYGDYEGNHDGVMYRISLLGGAFLVWVIQSPYYQEYRACSPCVPGAHNIDIEEPILDTIPDDVSVGYCVPKDWLQAE